MKFKKQKPLLGVLLGAGLYYLVDSLREHLPDNVDDIKGRVRDTYDTASERVSRASNALRGKEDSQILGKVGALLIGVGIGVGIGLLVAPASGEETRAEINDKVAEFSGKVRQSAKKSQGASETHGG
jgi:gas vesicle protein